MAALAATEAARLLTNCLKDGTKTYTIGLFLTNPTINGTGTEVSGGSYARKAIAFGAISEVLGKQSVSNSSAIDFGVMTTNIGEVGYWAIFDNSDNMKYFGAFATPKTFTAGDAIEIGAGDIACILS